MMLSIGDTLMIGGREATVCYMTQYYGNNYICVAFEQPQLEYLIYDYKYENGKLLVAKVTDPNEIRPVLSIFINEGLEQYGIPPELEDMLSQIPDTEE